MKEKIKKLDYKFIITNLIIIISYILILSVFGLHGHDDEYAYTYYFNPNITFLGKIYQIYDRGVHWNFRVGEILYFIFGSFPLWVSYIFHVIILITFINLIVYYALGYEKYKNKDNVNVLLMITYIVFMIINPIIAEVFFWSGGIFNHLLSATIILLVAVPYRNLIDGKQVFNKFNKKYLLYLLLCMIAGFQVESTVATLIVAMFVVNLISFIKNKKIDLLRFIPLIIVSLSFFIFLLLSKNRIIAQSMQQFSSYSKENLFSLFLDNRILQIFLLIIVLLLYLIIYKFKDLSEFKTRIYIFLVSFSSFVAMLFSPYYVDRGVFMLDVGVSILVVYLLYMLISKIKIKYILVFIFSILFIIIIYITFVYRDLYIDYNNYCKSRNNYITNQLDKGETFAFNIYKTDKNLIIYKLRERLINVAEGNESTKETINFKYNYNGDYFVNW